jgi:gas vesicle protein
MTKKIKEKNTMTYEEVSKKISKLLDNTETEMNNLIEQFNESNDDQQIDVVDLSHKFSELQDYIEDYS